MWFAAVPASADLLLSNGLTANNSGQATAHYQTVSNSFFDVFVDIEDVNNNTRCQPTDPCFPQSVDKVLSMTSKQFNSGYFKMSFQALIDGNPITVTGAGLNQQQTGHDSFFDIYFDVNLAPDGPPIRAALGIDVTAPIPPPITPTPLVTGPGAIGWRTGPEGPPIRQSTFELDPMAFETFDIILQTSLTLPNDPPPPLTPNPNVVPEPSSVLLLATVVIVASRWRPRAAGTRN